jgi:RNA polymerase sigma-70 factor, ECF subfamily
MKSADETNAEKQLVARLAAGDHAALGELYDRLSGLLLALARRIVHDPAEAEEIVQDAFLQAFKQAGRYDPQRSSVATWLVLITRSRAIDRLRTERVGLRTRESFERENRGRHESPPDGAAVLSEERRRRLKSELETLPAEQRHVLEWAFFGGMTQAEIATKTGIPLGTVKTRTLLAMKKLRHALQDDFRDLM